jgi:predicted nucleotidyltransferase
MDAIGEPRIPIPQEVLRDFCERWGISELALFGSVLRDDFGPESDVDVLVTFRDPGRWRLRDLQAMEQDLGSLFGHRVELTERTAIEENPNWVIRREIHGTARRVDIA